MTLRRPSFVVLTICLAAVLVAVAATVVLVPWTDGSANAGVADPERPDPAVEAETSFTYAATLARLIEKHCGKMETHSLDAASEAEMQADPAMSRLAVAAAIRRAETMTSKSCSHVDREIDAAERRAAGGESAPAGRG